MAVAPFLPPRSSPLDPPDVLKQLRARNPVSKVTLWNGKQAWLVTRHADAASVLADPRFSMGRGHPNMPSLAPAQAASSGRWSNMSRFDGTQHAELRRPVSPEFTRGRMEAFRPTIVSVVDAQISKMLAATPPLDFISAFAQPVPSLVVARLLGAPEDDLPLFQEYTQLAFDPDTPVTNMKVIDDELYDRVDHIVTQSERTPRDDLLGRLVAGGLLDHEGLINVAMLVLTAGHVSTAGVTGLAVLSLLSEPGLFRGLRERPELVPHTVEEVLRYHTVGQFGLRRVATEDVEVAGTLIRSGDGVIIMIPSANRDEHVFDNPDRFDIQREQVRHLGFGTGPHVCLGQWLARFNLQVTIEALTTRVPTLRLAVPFGKLRFQEDRINHGVYELPVSW